MDSGIKTTNQDGTRTDVGTIIDIASGKVSPTVNFETSISKTSIITLSLSVLAVGLILIYAYKA